MAHPIVDKILSLFTSGGSSRPSQAEVDAAKYRVGQYAQGDTSVYHDMAMAQIAEENPEMYAALQQQEFEQASAREVMKFNAEQAQINRDWQTNANKIAMDFEASEAQKNRDWIDHQRATAYQVAMSDMKAAGLNPILAASNGGAATVGGSVASGFSSSGSSASGVAASGSKANTDYVGKREFAQSLVSAASQIGMSVLLRRSFGK